MITIKLKKGRPYMKVLPRGWLQVCYVLRERYIDCVLEWQNKHAINVERP